jgi:hypothetical protein
MSSSGPRVVLSPHNVVAFPEGGGHFWAYMQHVQGLRAVGCDVWWLERLPLDRDRGEDGRRIGLLAQRLAAYGMRDRLLLYEIAADGAVEWITPHAERAERVARDADLLLNLHYAMPQEMLARFRRTALLDIDPGLLQQWIASEELAVAPHDVYFTIGETVGTAEARFPDCGIDWLHVHPAVSLADWPRGETRARDCLTSVSSWWGDEWIVDGRGEPIENNKRVSFLEFVELPRLVGVTLELALYHGPGDRDDLRLLEQNGWVVRHSLDTVSTHGSYRDYIRSSLGELSAAKPSCMLFQNAWVSDRTLCYLASGRPAVVQDTGPSRLLDGRDGLLRFSTLEQAARAIDDLLARYQHHSDAAFELAAELFDARKVAQSILDAACGGAPPRGETPPAPARA